jgi:hypothetical protein
VSHHSDHKAEKKKHKLAQLLHNRRIQRINQVADEQTLQRDLDAEREDERKKAALAGSRNAATKKKEANPAWSARMQEIRDRNTGKKRMANDRWNRFAGTESGGGRGL